MLKFIKRNIGPIITFFLTIILTLFIFYEVGILDGTILISDLNAEYQPLLLQVRRILTGEMSIYNFNTGMGDSFIGTFYYYMSSPLNILTLFIKDINKLVIVLVTLKLALASLFSYFFFKYQFKEEKRKYLIIFSILYALSSFSLSYYLHIMWLDIYLLLPLLLLGIDKIIKEKKHLLYIVSLIMMIFCNYYFAYMVCIFSFIYFNYKLLINKKSIKDVIKQNIHFIIVSLLACIGASIVLIPIASEISTYSRQNSMLFGGEILEFNFNIINIVKNYILGNVENIELLNENNFYLYTSIIVIPLLYFYFISKHINKREKVLSTILLLLLILSISCNYVNYAWHGFVPPSFFNGRYTFMFILVILLLSLKGLYYLEDYKIYHYIIIFSIIFIPIIILVKFNNSFSLNAYDIMKLVILAIVLFILKMIPNNRYCSALLLACVLYEVNINGYLYLSRYNFNSSTGDDTYKNAVGYIKDYEKEDKFYRIEDNNSNSDNYSILYNYYSIDYFMSTVKKDLINFFINLDVGNHGYTKNTISYDGSFHLISSLLNVKYYIETKGIDNNTYKALYTNNYTVYNNPYSLNIGYMVNEKIIDTKMNNNGLDNLKRIYTDMNNIDVLTEIELNKTDDYNYYFNNTSNNNFYILVKLKNWYSYDDLKVYVNNVELSNTNNTYYYHVNNDYEIDNTVNISISCNDGTLNDIEGIYVYYYDMDKFEETINQLKEHELIVTNVNNNEIKGNVTVDSNNILFTSIPYNENIDVYVDGKKQNKLKLLDTFIGVKLDKGEHEIKIKYTPKTLYISIIPSILSLIILYGYLTIYKKILKKKKILS